MATTTNVYAAVPFPAGARKVNDWTDAGRPDAFGTFDCSRWTVDRRADRDRVRKDGHRRVRQRAGRPLATPSASTPSGA
jgi:hypothetical protein